jgi:hypothetical protein
MDRYLFKLNGPSERIGPSGRSFLGRSILSLMARRTGTLLTYRPFGPAPIERIGPTGPLLMNKMTIR